MFFYSKIFQNLKFYIRKIHLNFPFKNFVFDAREYMRDTVHLYKHKRAQKTLKYRVSLFNARQSLLTHTIYTIAYKWKLKKKHFKQSGSTKEKNGKKKIYAQIRRQSEQSYTISTTIQYIYLQSKC